MEFIPDRPVSPSVGGFGDYLRMGIKGILQWLNAPSLSGIRLECYSYEEILESKISSQMLVNFDKGKQVVNDNIAPMPRTWNIGAYIGSATIGWGLNVYASGGTSPFDTTYLPGAIGTINLDSIIGNAIPPIPIPGLEPSVYFMPSLKQQKDILTNAWLNHKLIWFVDKYKNYIPVAMERCTFLSDPSIQNKIPIQVTLKEVILYNGYKSPYIGDNISKLGTTFFPDVQSSASPYVSMGNGTSSVVGKSVGLP